MLTVSHLKLQGICGTVRSVPAHAQAQSWRSAKPCAERSDLLQDLGLDDDDLAQEKGQEGASKSRMADLFGSSDEE